MQNKLININRGKVNKMQGRRFYKEGKGSRQKRNSISTWRSIINAKNSRIFPKEVLVFSRVLKKMQTKKTKIQKTGAREE
jgi:hypothetical protein